MRPDEQEMRKELKDATVEFITFLTVQFEKEALRVLAAAPSPSKAFTEEVYALIEYNRQSAAKLLEELEEQLERRHAAEG